MRLLECDIARMLGELDMLDVFAGAATVQGEAVPDDLNDIGRSALGKLVGRFRAGKVAAVLYGALNELMRFEALFGLRDHAVVDVAAADIDGGVKVVGQAAKLANLLAVKCHGRETRFLINHGVCNTIPYRA